ncbi:putative pentatricopeptide repeat-containing protein At3g13770, mitochondrial [Mercurialis annua]|uniref:putative pentatricopeptide repeat-containing protein At3g13770, mitochondrial n=1 Tax=Mercurialis annua TaxID=3986 RepID=UPI00215F44C1|nr:putative pentatricopeptide repeat-containing protein At3g13770, mitochondrial [Mercurialis annua]
MASLPSVTLTGSLKLQPELKRHPSSSLPTEKSQSIPHQRGSINTQLDGNFEAIIKPLDSKEALSFIRDDEAAKVEPSYYFPLLHECIANNSISETQIIHAHIIKTGAHQDLSLMTFLVNVYGKCGSMSNAQTVFDKLSRRNVVAWTSLMTGFVQNSQPYLAIEVFQDMLDSEILPSNFTLGIALNASSSINSIELGKQLHAFVIKYLTDYDSSIGNSLCSLYSNFRSLESSINIFRSIREKNVISWTAVISACGGNGDAAKGLKFFDEMLHEDIMPNEFTFATVFSLCCVMLALNVGRQVHSLSIKRGYQSNLRISNSVMYLYLKCGCMDEARNLFDKMEITNSVTWNAMIAGHAQAMDTAKDDFVAYRSGLKALHIYLKLNRTGMKSDPFTLSSVLTVCSKLLALEQGEQFHAHTIKSGFLSDVVVGTAVVNMYTKCGSIQKASKVFVEMSTRTLISWTTMITSFAQHGFSQQALQLFEDMRLAGLRPNQITFVGVLAACCHAGMVDEAFRYFDMMQKEYKLKPVMDHYGCLVAMFVKMHRIDEAFDIVKKMDFEPSEFIWSLLIAGCRNHDQQELGFYAAEKLLMLKPKDTETYVMLLNMYISAERWQDVTRLRKFMKEEKLGKLNDWSWISIKDRIHSFKTKRRSRRQNAEVYGLLQELLDKAKDFGYLPPKCMQDHDYDDDDDDDDDDGKDEDGDVAEDEMEKDKFSSALKHSERLAVAFGLLNVGKGAPVRVIKSVSMCKNCHDFVKIVSSLCNREIIIRDSRRLHKFVNGQCSCADFDDLL